MKKNKIFVIFDILILLFVAFILARCIKKTDFSEIFWSNLVICVVYLKHLIAMLYSIRGGNAGNFRWNIVNIVVDAVILILTLIGYQSLSFLWREFGIFILIITIFDVSSCVHKIRNSYKEK